MGGWKYFYSDMSKSFLFNRSIGIKYIIEPKIPILKELEEGMNSFGFLTEARRQSTLFESLFVSSNRFFIILDNFLDDLLIEYSQSQMMKEKKDTFKYFSDSLLEISYDGDNKKFYMLITFKLLHDILVFLLSRMRHYSQRCSKVYCRD